MSCRTLKQLDFIDNNGWFGGLCACMVCKGDFMRGGYGGVTVRTSELAFERTKKKITFLHTCVPRAEKDPSPHSSLEALHSQTWRLGFE